MTKGEKRKRDEQGISTAPENRPKRSKYANGTGKARPKHNGRRGGNRDAYVDRDAPPAPTTPLRTSPESDGQDQAVQTTSVTGSPIGPASSLTALPVPPLPVYGASDVSELFEQFSQSLSKLLTIPEATLENALGDEHARGSRSSFIEALRAMKEANELPWLPKPTPPSPTRTSHTNTPTLPLVPAWPPPLPPINNSALRKRIFTHSSSLPGELSGTPDFVLSHYERLEFLGDAYLQSISSHLLYKRFPGVREGPLTEMRSSLVNNKMLYSLATAYKFDRQLHLGRSFESENLPKVIADCLEAYIGGIIVDSELSAASSGVDPITAHVNGVRVAEQWLGMLFEPRLCQIEQQLATIEPIDRFARQKFSLLTGGTQANLDYRWEKGDYKEFSGFWVDVYLTGWGLARMWCGRGWGVNKPEAYNRAAKNALDNPAIVKKITEAKESTLGPKLGIAEDKGVKRKVGEVEICYED